jgi:tetratricopeptide (TPR) repeat protein
MKSTHQTKSRKSHIAIEYCYRFYEQHSEGLILWIFAGSPARLHQSLIEISRKLSIPSETNGALVDLLKWIDNSSHPDWLLVFDGVMPKGVEDTAIPDSVSASAAGPEQTVLTDLWNWDPPKASRGKILLTAQEFDLSYASRMRITSIIMPPWTAEEAITLLQLKAPRDKRADLFAKDVVELLELHPLAIIHAASCITRNGYSTEQYLQQMRALYMPKLTYQKNHPSNVLQKTCQGLEISMSISFAQLKMEKPRAIDLLFLVSTLDSQGIPRTLLFRNGEKVRSFNAAIRVLKSFSMLTEDFEGENLYFHELVHSWVQKKLKSEDLWMFWNAEVIKLLAERFRYGDFDYRRNCSFLMPHATKVVGLDLTEGFCLQCSRAYKRHRATLLQGMASYDQNRGLYNPAYLKMDEALSIIKGLEPSWKNRRTIIGITKEAAKLLCYSGSYEKAKHLLEDLRENGTGENEWDEEDVSLLNVYNALARIAHEQADYKTALEYYEKALEANIKEHYKDHVDSLIIKSNLAGLKKDQGNYAEAGKMIREVLEARQALRGTEHPDTLQSMSDLAVVLAGQGNYPEAEKFCREALDIANKIQGAEHPDTLTIYGNLAGVLSQRGKYEEGASMQSRLLALKEAALGSEHPFLITIRNNLAVDLEKMGEYAEAEKVFKPAVAQAEKAFGKDHPTTLNAMNGLGLVLLRQGKHQEAEPMLKNVLESRIKFFGKEHPQTLISMNNLAGCLQRQSLFPKAEILHKDALAGAQKVLGEKHPFTLRSMNNVAEVLREQGNEYVEKLVEAEGWQRKALAGREDVLGEDHPETFTSVYNLAQVLKQEGRVNDALPLYKRALKGFEEKLGKENATTKACAEELAHLLSQGKEIS